MAGLTPGGLDAGERGLRLVGWLALSGLCVLFGALMGSDNWIAGLAIVGLLLGLRIVMAGPWWMALVWLVAVPVVGVFFDNALAGVPFVRARRVAFVVVLLMMWWQVAVDKHRWGPRLPVERRMLQFLAVATASVVLTGTDKSLADFVREDISLLVDGYVIPMSGFLLARRIAWDTTRLLRFSGALLGLGIFLALTAPLETLLGIDWFIPQTLNAIHTIQRATGTFGNAAEYGLVVASMFLLASWFNLHSRDAAVRATAPLAMLLLLAAVVLCKTRAPWFGLVVSMAVLYGLEARSRPLLNVVAFIGALGVAAALPFLLAMEGFVDRISDPSPVYNRLASWATAINITLQNPLTGIGMSRHAFGANAAAYAVGVGDVSSAWIVHLAVPHNEFLNVASMTGLLGGALYVAVVGGVIATLAAMRRDRTLDTRIRALASVVIAIWVGWVVNACFSDFGSFAYVNVFVYFLGGMTIAMWRPAAHGAGAPGPATGAQTARR